MKPTLTYPITSKQVAFDYVWHHFITEKNPAAVDGPMCVYNTPSGGCAVGCLLPSDVREQMPFGPIGHEHVFERAKGCFAGAVGSVFLTKLQRAHDSSAEQITSGEDDRDPTPEEFRSGLERRLRELAIQEGLVVPQ